MPARVFGVFGGPSGIQPGLLGLFGDLRTAKRFGRKMLDEDEDYFYEVVVIYEIPVGIPWEPEKSKHYDIAP